MTGLLERVRQRYRPARATPNENAKGYETELTKPSKGGGGGLLSVLSVPISALPEKSLPAWWADAEAREERAAIMEYDGGLSRVEAERATLLSERRG